jgi:hypothetical protein
MNKHNYEIMTGKKSPEILSEYILRIVALELGYTNDNANNNERIVLQARKIEDINPEMWKDIHWLRAVASAEDYGKEGWREWYTEEAMDDIDEYLENENENEQGEEQGQETKQT